MDNTEGHRAHCRDCWVVWCKAFPRLLGLWLALILVALTAGTAS